MEKTESLESIYQQLSSDMYKLPTEIKKHLNVIGENCHVRKGVYTVLTTLLYYKYIHPEQDIRYFQASMPNGFSARSFDTAYITPVLKRLGLPAMSESGWLTRSLEQPYPYTFSYNGKIPPKLKEPFLKILDYVQKNPYTAKDCLCVLLLKVKEIAEQEIVNIIPLQNPDNITIDNIMNGLAEHFLTKYNVKGGAKLPVLAFHSIYTILIKELARYNGCKLADLSSLTACDRTNKASGDIEIFDSDENLFEAIEIKLDKQIDSQIIRIVEDKVYKWNPQRYYVLSVYGIKESDKDEIKSIVDSVKSEHGCQIIINGLLPTIKYYLRLISKLDSFVAQYSKEVEIDKELQPIHKTKWNEIINNIFN